MGAEGESELVSGFNIEYGSVMFALIFFAEYASIIFIRIIFSIFFFFFYICISSKKKKIEKIILIKIILAYSAIKIKANITLPYSILKPETNSDSPSAKSKGVRLVSAIHEINQIPTLGKKILFYFNRYLIL